MTTIPLALRFLLLVVSGWVSRQQHDVIELWSCTTSWDIPPTGGEEAAGLANP